MQRPLPLVLAACALGAWLPSAALAQPTGNSPHPTIPADAAVDFGVLPTAPLGPPRACNPAPSAVRQTRAPTRSTTSSLKR